MPGRPLIRLSSQMPSGALPQGKRGGNHTRRTLLTISGSQKTKKAIEFRPNDLTTFLTRTITHPSRFIKGAVYVTARSGCDGPVAYAGLRRINRTARRDVPA